MERCYKELLDEQDNDIKWLRRANVNQRIVNKKLQEENERLNNENKMLKEAVKEKVIATCNTCEDYGVCPHSYREYDLDNIINELEKYLNEQIQKSWEIEEQCYENVLGELQELKGSDKE